MCGLVPSESIHVPDVDSLIEVPVAELHTHQVFDQPLTGILHRRNEWPCRYERDFLCGLSAPKTRTLIGVASANVPVRLPLLTDISHLR